MKIIKTTIKAGATKPFKLLHMTDSHIYRDDMTGWNRKGTFDVDYDGCTEDYFLEALKYAKDNNMVILHTGDLIDFFSEGNFEFLKKHFTGDIDYIYAAGNHDFVDFKDMKNGKSEDKGYKETQIHVVAPYIKNNLYFYSRMINGVNIVTMDDSYYLISKGQLDMLKAEVAKGYPIILAMHVPIYTERLAASMIEDGHPCAYVVAPLEELLMTYPENRKQQQTPDSETIHAVEYIKNEPMIKAVITGHNHKNFEEKINNDVIQYTTHGSFAGYVREITIE